MRGRISIAGRNRPFSHLPGSCCLIPSTPYLVEAFPTLIRVKELTGNVIKEIPIEVKGPVRQFTLIQDLERGCVTLFSELYTMQILPSLKVLSQKKPPLQSLHSHERLSLGVHKKQEWEEIRKRRDFREIFPLWFRLGSLLSLPRFLSDQKGMFSLLQSCYKVYEDHRPERLLDAFERLFLCGFSHFMIPRSVDEDHHGILENSEELYPNNLKNWPKSNSSGCLGISQDSPLYLLSEGAALIRSLFLLQSANHFSILPNLPPELFAGRMLNLLVPPYGQIQLEWSKKLIRRLEMAAEISGEVTFHFQPSIRQFRLRQNHEVKGKFYKNGESLAINSGSYYLLDQFQK